MSTLLREPKGFNFQTHDFDLHEYQEDAWYSLEDDRYREIALLAGIQGGKTVFGALATVKQIGVLRKIHPQCNFIVGADTYKTLTQATIPTLMKLIGTKLGHYNQGKQEMPIRGGGKIYFRTGTDPYSVEGIQDCAFAWIDEAGKCSKMFQINILGRVARLKGRVLYTSTPYAMNWLYHDVEKPAVEGTRDDIKIIRFSSADNPAFPREEFERQKLLLDSKTFRRKYMGIHERMEGLVYELTSDNNAKSDKLPNGTRFFASVDWGFAEGHEFAILVRAITLDGFRYEVDEFKASGLDPQQQIHACMAKRSTWNIERFFCDPARPDMIAALNKAGGRGIGFHSGKENFKPILPGITEHVSLIRSGKYKIWTDRCTHLLDEYETYHWPEFQDDKEQREVPVGINDHLMDCARMLTVGTMGVVVKEPYRPFLGQKRPHQDHFDFKKKSRHKSSEWTSS